MWTLNTKLRPCFPASYPGAPPRRWKWGDGDQAAAKPGFSSEGNPYQKPKTQRILAHYFPENRGIIPRTLKIGGTRPPRPPLWRSPWSYRSTVKTVSAFNGAGSGPGAAAVTTIVSWYRVGGGRALSNMLKWPSHLNISFWVEIAILAAKPRKSVRYYPKRQQCLR